jgi:hypothetical protein
MSKAIKEHTIKKIEEVFKELLINEFDNSDSLCLLVPTTDDWEFPLPKNLTEVKNMFIEISDWTKENSYYTDDGVYIVTAFGDDENSKLFRYEEIKALANENKLMLLTKPYDEQDINPEPEKQLTLSDIMHKDPEGIKHSMSKLSLVTKKKKDK